VFVRVLSFAVRGVEAVPVGVEVDVSPGVPFFEVVGLPDASVREARERVRAALKNGGWDLPPLRITVNLAPAHLRKAGPGFDLAIALGLLAATGQLCPEALAGVGVTGELALDGALRPTEGALAMALIARQLGLKALLLSSASAPEAAAAGGLVYGAPHLADLIGHLTGAAPLSPVAPDVGPARLPAGPDLAEVRGQAVGRRALEVAAAGGHNLLMIGPPGAGKSLLACCLPSLLPPLHGAEQMEVSRIYSVAGRLPGGNLMSQRPFRAPHHSASRAALLGGGNPCRPGELTLAHRGVLFLDELPEFGRDVLEGLRQPLEEGQVQIARSHGSYTLPGRAMLVGAANPCPCGHLGSSTRPCTCPPAVAASYLSRLSGPLLDRFDLQLYLSPVPYEQFQTSEPAETSASVLLRVEEARARQIARLGPGGTNAAMTPALVRRFCRVPATGEALLRAAVERLGLSMRGHDRVLKLARTIADLVGADSIGVEHLAEAIQYRSLDRSQLGA
jgi:magnesium chelatase family protein